MPNVSPGGMLVIWIAVAVIVFFGAVAAILSRYRKCPSDKIMVVYGKIGDRENQPQAAKCIHGGATFIIPIIQSYEYLDLTPISISVDLRSALSRQNIRIDVPSKFTVGISTEPNIMQNAAERLLGLKLNEVQELARDIIFGQLRLVIAQMDIEEINTDRDKFLSAVSNNVEGELKKIGLRLINVNMTDITDESGYIDALGKEAAAKAINDAKISVAEKDRDGNIGAANAQRDQRIQVAAANSSAVEGENTAAITVANSLALRREHEAEANRRATVAERVAESRAQQEAYAAQQEAINDAKISVAEKERDGNIGAANAQRDQRVQVAVANSSAVEGENTAAITVANSLALRREHEAETNRRAIVAEQVAEARVQQETYAAQKEAEIARAHREKATMEADIIIKAEIEKRRIEIDAEAGAEMIRRQARGEADAIFAKMEAQARGVEELLSRQATGLAKIMNASGGNADAAVKMMIADKLEDIVKAQTEAISNLKIDKVTVWDSGQEGKSSTANFASGLLKSLPPLNDIFEMAGLSLPSIVSVKGKEPAPDYTEPAPHNDDTIENS